MKTKFESSTATLRHRLFFKKANSHSVIRRTQMFPALLWVVKIFRKSVVLTFWLHRWKFSLKLQHNSFLEKLGKASFFSLRRRKVFLGKHEQPNRLEFLKMTSFISDGHFVPFQTHFARITAAPNGTYDFSGPLKHVKDRLGKDRKRIHCSKDWDRWSLL